MFPSTHPFLEPRCHQAPRIIEFRPQDYLYHLGTVADLFLLNLESERLCSGLATHSALFLTGYGLNDRGTSDYQSVSCCGVQHQGTLWLQAGVLRPNGCIGLCCSIQGNCLEVSLELKCRRPLGTISLLTIPFM